MPSFLRLRRTPPREVGVEVIRPKTLDSPMPAPRTQPSEPAPTDEPTPGPPEELPTGQLLADIAPAEAEPPAQGPVVQTGTPTPRSEEHTETMLQPQPARAQPPLPALDPATARREQSVDEAMALQNAGPAADEAYMPQPIEEKCAIGVWHGYVKSRFYAGLIGGAAGEGIEYALAETQPLRLRGNGRPERTPAAAKAHQVLVDYLIESGWRVEPPADGDSWYALRFRRTAPA
jgi:hypothetical protein